MNPVFSFLAVDIGYLYSIARDYYHSAKKQQETWNPQNLHSFCLLVTTSAELLLKSIIATNICLEEKDNIHSKSTIKELVVKKFKKLDHNIKKLIEESGIIQEFSIVKIDEVKNGFVSDYRIYLESREVIALKDSESVRFGSLAKDKDLAVLIDPHLSGNIINFLDDLEKFYIKKHREVLNIVKKKVY